MSIKSVPYIFYVIKKMVKLVFGFLTDRQTTFASYLWRTVGKDAKKNIWICSTFCQNRQNHFLPIVGGQTKVNSCQSPPAIGGDLSCDCDTACLNQPNHLPQNQSNRFLVNPKRTGQLIPVNSENYLSRICKVTNHNFSVHLSSPDSLY